jgi:hypothetical protein
MRTRWKLVGLCAGMLLLAWLATLPNARGNASASPACSDSSWPAGAPGWETALATTLKADRAPDARDLAPLPASALLLDLSVDPDAVPEWLEVACVSGLGNVQRGFVLRSAVHRVLGCADVPVPRPGTIFDVVQWRVTAPTVLHDDATNAVLGRLRPGTVLGDAEHIGLPSSSVGVACWRTRAWLSIRLVPEVEVLPRNALVGRVSRAAVAGVPQRRFDSQ